MALKIWNIGKANAEIDRLTSELAALQAKAPADNSTQLAEAVASNEQVSAQLAQVSADLTTARVETYFRSCRLPG